MLREASCIEIDAVICISRLLALKTRASSRAASRAAVRAINLDLILQNERALNMQPCSKLLAANQTWKVAAEQGRIVSASSGMCLE